MLTDVSNDVTDAADLEFGAATDRVGERSVPPSPAVAALARQAQAGNTRRAYAGDWAHFTAWAARHEQQALPAQPGTVAQYVADLAALTRPDGRPAYTPATVARRVAGINFVHRRAGHLPPGAAELVQATLAGLRRSRATPPRRMKALPLTTLGTVLDAIDTRSWPAAVIGRRDRALLLLGWASALRRAELAALRREDLTAHPEDGLHLLIRTSKTDPDAAGATLAVPFGTTPATCAACAVTDWVQVLDAWDGHAGPHRSMAGVARRPAVLRLLLTDAAPSLDPDLDRDPDRNGGAVSHTDPANQQRPDQPADRHRCHHPTRGRRPAGGAPQLPGEPGERGSPDGGWGWGPLLRPVTRAATIGDRPLAGDAVHAVVRRRLAAAGLDPAGFGAHSLRAGFVTDAYRAGASTHAITRQTRHRDPATVAAYARHYTPLEVNAVTQVGL